jgi:peptidoglycan hydrolase-like protein with peptidoglycan-binding domain
MENRTRTVLKHVAVTGLLSLVTWLLLVASPAFAAVPPPAPAAPPSTLFPSPAAPATTAPVVTSTLDVGSSGPAVQAVEQRLDALHYFVGTVDDKYDDDTAQAVTAFQKVNNLDRTGKVDPQVWQAMTTATDPAPIIQNGEPNRVDIDLNRQVLFLYQNGQLAKIIAVASGKASTPTPTGDYAIYRKDGGWETSPLGQLYNAQYFTGGYAIHGSTSVPAEPASHGCVRIPMTAADWFPDQVPMGTPVHIR